VFTTISCGVITSLAFNPVKQGFSIKKVLYDLNVIVIDSGIGGLSTAAILAKEGKRVLVLELTIAGSTSSLTNALE